MRTRTRSRAVAALTAGLVVAGGGIAAADNLISDGDGVVATHTDSNWSVGSVCAASSGSRVVPVYVTRNGNGTNTFKNGSTVSISATAVAGSTVETGSKTVTLPSDWGSMPNNSTVGDISFAVGYTAPTTLGAFSRKVTFSGAGTNSQNEAITRTDDLTVSGTVVACESSAPVITPTVIGTLGDNGWYTSDVSLTWSIVDDESVITSRSGCDSVSVMSDQVATTYTCSATSAGGSASRSVTIKRDATAPVITPGDVDDSTWRNTSLSQGFTATDGTSGLASPSDSAFTLEASRESLNASTPTTASKIVIDNAGNSTTRSLSALIDMTPPSVEVVGGPAEGASYYFGSVPAAPTCNASDDRSGLAGQCSVSGGGDTVGLQSYTVTARDNAGNITPRTVRYEVLAWTLQGFYSPVDMGATVWNTVKGGATVPLKFEVFAGSELTTTTAINATFTAKAVTCPGDSSTKDEIEMLSTGGTSLRFDTTAGQFIQNWATPRKPGSCYAVTVTTADGSTRTANFILK